MIQTNLANSICIQKWEEDAYRWAISSKNLQTSPLVIRMPIKSIAYNDNHKVNGRNLLQMAELYYLVGNKEVRNTFSLKLLFCLKHTNTKVMLQLEMKIKRQRSLFTQILQNTNLQQHYTFTSLCPTWLLEVSYQCGPQ